MPTRRKKRIVGQQPKPSFEEQHEQGYVDLRGTKLCARGVNTYDGVLTGEVCPNHHTLQARAHYWSCTQTNHPTDRWETFPDTLHGWEWTAKRLQSAQEYRQHQMRAMYEAHKDAITRMTRFQIAEDKIVASTTK